MLNALTDFDGLYVERVSSPVEELAGFRTSTVYNVHGINKKPTSIVTQSIPLPSAPTIAYSPPVISQQTYLPPPYPFFGSVYIPPTALHRNQVITTEGAAEVILPAQFQGYTVAYKNLFEVQLTEKPRKAWDGDKDKDYFIRTSKHNLVFIVEQPPTKFRKKILVYDSHKELLGSVKKKFGLFHANLAMFDQYADPVLYARGMKFPTWHKMRVKDNNMTRAKSKVKYTTPGEFYWSANSCWELLTNGEKSFVVAFPYWADVQERSLIFAAAIFADGIWY